MGGDKILDQIFNLKFTSKQLIKSSSKCEKEEKTEKLKVQLIRNIRSHPIDVLIIDARTGFFSHFQV